MLEFLLPGVLCTKPTVYKKVSTNQTGIIHSSFCKECYCLSILITAGVEKILGNKASKKLFARAKGKNQREVWAKIRKKTEKIRLN